jgi:excisionase family DNA binding protein
VGDTNERLETMQEIADFLGVPVATMRAWRNQRRGPVSYKVGRHVRYRRSEVEAWLNETANAWIAENAGRPSRGAA